MDHGSDHASLQLPLREVAAQAHDGMLKQRVGGGWGFGDGSWHFDVRVYDITGSKAINQFRRLKRRRIFSCDG
jgi:hypothetical protein